MFVAVSCDLSNEDHIDDVRDILKQFGFKEVQKNLFESARLKENTVSRLKRELDKATDSFDKLRFYQFPIKETLVITELVQKKWKRIIVRDVIGQEH
ncbi:MAG: CRISPR-associated endonuclease Cas2 [Spirochaetales bacterium]|nr:CRISPR-associated endonuclease Cas2 [Spirochaetales bacterium]